MWWWAVLWFGLCVVTGVFSLGGADLNSCDLEPP